MSIEEFPEGETIHGVKRKSTAGQKPKFCAELAEKIIHLIREGNYQETAARANGVEPATICRWVAIGRKLGHGPLYEFGKAIKKAEADAEAYAVGIIKTAMIDNWPAAMTYLERKNYERWGRRTPVEDNKKAKLELEKLQAEIEVLKAKKAEMESLSSLTNESIQVVVPDYTNGHAHIEKAVEPEQVETV